MANGIAKHRERALGNNLLVKLAVDHCGQQAPFRVRHARVTHSARASGPLSAPGALVVAHQPATSGRRGQHANPRRLHSREKLWAQRPARPRSGDDDEADTHNLGVLRRVQIKYIRSDRELRDLLISFHLGGDEVPHTLIIDDLPAIIADPSSRTATSPHGATQGSPAGPSPSKQAACANMHLALAAGLAAHAADFIDAKYGSSSGGGGGIATGGLDAPTARAGGVLLVSCTAPTADTMQLLSRWLPAQLRVTRAASHGVGAHGMPGTQRHAAYTLSAAHALAPPDAFEPLTQRSLAPAQSPVHYSLAEGRLVHVEALTHGGSHVTACVGMEPPRTPVSSMRPPNAYTPRDVCPQPCRFEQ